MKRLQSLRTPAFAVLVLLGFFSARAANYYVDTAAQFNAAVDKNGASFATLSTGDRVYLKGGNWEGLQRTLTGSMTDAEAQANPAVVYACDANYVPAVGGVIVDGLSQIQLAGCGITFAGVTFSPKSGMLKAGDYTDYSGNDSTAYIFNMPAQSRYMTLSHIKFDHCGDENTDYANNDHYGAWVLVYGYRHTVQYCEVEGRSFDPTDYLITDPAFYTRRKSIRQATFVIYKSDNDTTEWGYHTIRRNYFGERLVPASSDPRLYAPADGSLIADASNGWETIRIGNGSLVSVDLNTTVEYNTFYHALQAVGGGVSEDTGEPEICSNKSRKNTYRYNTFLNSYGQLCLRNGDYGVVQGNYFLAGGAYDSKGAVVLTDTLNTKMGGVRVIGFGHTVANNYFYKLGSTGAGAALCLYEGFTDPGTLANLINSDGSTNYETANYSQIIGNTFIDCKEINLDYDNGDPTQSIYPIYGTQFVNNLIYYSSNIGASGIIGKNTDSLANHGGLARGNFVYSSNSGQRGNAATMLGTSGNTITGSINPLMSAAYDVLIIPSSSSPLIGAAAALPTITDTTTEAANYDLAGHVSTYGALDMRGLIRPATGRDIGAYERDATGNGARPLRRYEVGPLAATYPGYAVVSEKFADGTRDATGDGNAPPLSLRWFCSGATSNNTTVSSSNGTFALTGTTTSLSTRQAVAYFPAQTLAIGDVITLSFQFSITAPLDSARGLRAALLSNGTNSLVASDAGSNPTAYTGTGYGTFINPAPIAASPAAIVERSNVAGTIVTTPIGTPWVTASSGGAQQSLVSGTTYTATLTVRRTSATTVSLNTTYTGGSLTPVSVSTTDASGVFTFDTLALGVAGSTVGSITYSNISVAKTTPLVAAVGAINGTINSAVDVSLLPLVSSLTSPFTPLTFTVSTPVNGTVALLADGVTARFTPTANFSGTATFAYAVTDGTDSAFSTVSITYMNSPPGITAIADQTVNEDQVTGAIAFIVSDAATAAAAITVTAASSNPGIVPVDNMVFGGSGANRTLIITPAPNQNGTVTITLFVSDGAASTVTSFVLTVQPVNDAPVASAGNTSTSPNQPVSVDLWSLISDLETLPSGLSFAVTGSTNGSAVLDADGHTVRFTPASNYSGPANFTYTVTDIATDPRVLFNYTFQAPDVSTDGVCTDASGNGRNGTMSALVGAGVATYLADSPAVLSPYTQAVNFYQNGNTDATKLVCGLGGTSVINLQTADWTAVGWFKRSSTPTDEDILFHLGSGIGNGGTGNELTLAFFDNSTPSTALTLKNWNGTLVSTSYTNDASIGTTATSGSWHHFAIVRSGAVLSLYVDGVSKGTDSSFAFTFDPTAAVMYGAAGGSTSTYARAFSGSMADLAIFSSALSAAEVTKLYTAPVARIGYVTTGNTVTVNVSQPTTAPVVTSPTSTAITGVSATLGGNVTSDGGAAVSARGIVYAPTSVNSAPTLSAAGVATLPVLGATGVFTGSVSGLTPGTSYSFAAYATNVNGTSYASNGTFVTLSNNADLSALSLGSVSYEPAFAAGTTIYAATVSNELTSLAVTPTTAQSNAAIMVNGVTVASGVSSGALSLGLGVNTLTINVTAQDGVTLKSYTVSITRQTALESWRQAFLGTASGTGSSADSADPDGDGWSNVSEYILGTNPTLAETGAGALGVAVSAGGLDLSFLARAASGTGYAGLTRHYSLESTSDLSAGNTWVAVSGFADVLGGGQPVLCTQAVTGTKVFYRLKTWLK